ncbi:MAG: DUF3604 domain-containing protein [Hyphomicrobium sp.]
MNTKTVTTLAAALLCSAVLTPVAWADDPAGEPGRTSGSKNPLNNVYFGEQHLHTVNSPDAFAFGTRNGPDDAYNFCKGEAIKKSTTGEMIQKKTPYDWCAVTDHAEYMGMMPLLLNKDNPLKETDIGKMIASGDPKQGEEAFQEIISSAGADKPIPYLIDPKIMVSVWDEQKKITNKHNDPGKFTTLIAFEWTSIPNFQNLHHNVFFRDDKGPDTQFSAFDSVKREDLWTYQEVQRAQGHENFSIPHNGNVSNGLMFAPKTSYGTQITKEWAERSVANTVATEIAQTKGYSETIPALSPNDEFAGFETYYKHLLGSGGVTSKVDGSFVRQGLITGVGFREMLGANPYKFGIVGGSDSHDAASDNEEFNYTGVHGNTDKTPKIRLESTGSVAGEAARFFSTPTTTAVWAPENTREAIFDAIKKKETYATSGTFIRLRFFGGWDYPDDLTSDKDFVKKAYAGGVPMGGDMPPHPQKDYAKVPFFAIWALKDPNSANLDRIQIVKGWYERGYAFEKVYDVVWSEADKRKVVADGKVPPVGNTVDIKTATYTNDIGDTQLSAVWKDPDFDPTHHAVYYARVIEIPTPRWTTYDAKALGVDPPKDVAPTLQERAWSSPIWYTPPAELAKKQPFYPGLQPFLP